MNLGASRLLETARFLNTKAGAELSDFITYVADITEKLVRAVSGNLSIEENLDRKVVWVNVGHLVDQVLNTGGKRPIGIHVLQVLSTTVGYESLGWYVNSSGETVVRVGLTGAPSTKYDVSLEVIFS